MEGADAAVGDATAFVADLVLDVAGGEPRPLAAVAVLLIEAALDAALALVPLAAYLGFPSKSSVWRGAGKAGSSSNPAKSRGISRFSDSFREIAQGLRLFKD
jgi:hypothetical protein